MFPLNMGYALSVWVHRVRIGSLLGLYRGLCLLVRLGWLIRSYMVWVLLMLLCTLLKINVIRTMLIGGLWLLKLMFLPHISHPCSSCPPSPPIKVGPKFIMELWFNGIKTTLNMVKSLYPIPLSNKKPFNLH